MSWLVSFYMICNLFTILLYILMLAREVTELIELIKEKIFRKYDDGR